MAHKKSQSTSSQVIPSPLSTSSGSSSDCLISSEIETEHVFRVYDSIATHWHHTRGRRKVYWHRVKSFIETLPPGSLIADVGSGDGKYFGVNPNCFSLGCDRSLNLLDVSKDAQFETFCCDAVKLPIVSDRFDAVLCIAVLHHLASVERRLSLIRELLRICVCGGHVMVQAWALEQEMGSKRLFEGQDVLVPWRLQKHFQTDEFSAASTDKDVMPEGPCTHMVEENGELVFQRFCHVYKEGELEGLCAEIPGCQIVESGFDKGNWFLLIRKIDIGSASVPHLVVNTAASKIVH